VSEVITKEDSVIMMIAILDGKYAGVPGNDKKKIDGRWYQGKGSLRLSSRAKKRDSALLKTSLRMSKSMR